MVADPAYPILHWPGASAGLNWARLGARLRAVGADETGRLARELHEFWARYDLEAAAAHRRGRNWQGGTVGGHEIVSFASNWRPGNIAIGNDREAVHPVILRDFSDWLGRVTGLPALAAQGLLTGRRAGTGGVIAGGAELLLGEKDTTRFQQALLRLVACRTAEEFAAISPGSPAGRCRLMSDDGGLDVIDDVLGQFGVAMSPGGSWLPLHGRAALATLALDLTRA